MSATEAAIKKQNQAKCLLAWQIVAVVLIVITIITIFTAIWFTSINNALYRACGEASYLNVVGAAGDTGARLPYRLVLDTYNERLDFTLYTGGTLSGIVTSITIRGPIGLGLLGSAPVATHLCGVGAAAACNSGLVVGQVTGTITKVHATSDPGEVGTAIKPLFVAIRDAPELYYLEILTTTHATSPGAARGPMSGNCGFPI
jgi:hypothetical protein